ncbi:MAG: hemerythrin domain-containing protein [Kofleriaceae bacterium]
MISKGAGVVEGVEARLHGLVGVFKTLSEQHGEAGALLKRVKSDPDKRSELWPKIRQALVSHEKGELAEVYPVMREYAELRSFCDHHEAEAGQLSVQIERLQATAMSTETWTQLFDQLCEMVERHVQEEQNQIFPKAQEVIGAARAEQIGPLFLATQKQIAGTLGAAT